MASMSEITETPEPPAEPAEETPEAYAEAVAQGTTIVDEEPAAIPEDFDSSMSRGSREEQAARSEAEVSGEEPSSALGQEVQNVTRCPACEWRSHDPENGDARLEAHAATHAA